MKICLKISFVVLTLIIVSTIAFAQTPSKIEQDFVGAIQQVQKYSNYGSNYDEEKLTAANKNFEASLLKYTKNSATLKFPFAQLGKEIFIATSADGKFRVYSWDEETGGTMHDYSRVYQYEGADGKVYSRTDDTAQEGDSGSFVYAIYTVSSKDGKIYAVCSTAVGDTQDHYDSADLFKIEGGELMSKVKLIKTNSGMTDTLNFEYNVFSVSDRPENPLRLIQFDAQTNTLKIPVVINDKKYPNGHVTNRFINYRFNGTNFVKVN